MASAHLTVRIPSEMIATLDGVAAALDRDRTWVVLRALRQYLETEGADVLQDAQGLAALDRGEGADFDHVMDEVEAIIADARATRAKRAAG